MAGIFGTRALFSDIAHANVNIYMMIWLALAWVFFLKGFDYWSGIFLALAIVTKVTPALLLIYFLYKRAWRVCLGATVGLALFFFIIPGFYLGFSRNWMLLTAWYHMLVAPFAREGYAALEAENQSLYGVLVRLLSKSGLLSIQHMTAERALDVGMESMARPATTAGRWLRPAVLFSTLAALAWLCRAKITQRFNPRLLLEFGLVLLAMLLLSERTWKHHATTLLLVYLGVWYALTYLPWSDNFRAWFVGGLVAQLILLVGLSAFLIGDQPRRCQPEAGLFCWGWSSALAQTGVLLHRLTVRETSSA